MLGSVVLLVLASWTAVSLFSVVRPLLPAALAVPGSGPVAEAIAALTSFALSLGAFALLYRFVPKANVTWSDVGSAPCWPPSCSRRANMPSAGT